MITDPDEFTSFNTFELTGVVTTDTFNLWRKKDNGVINLLSGFGANSASEAISVNTTTGIISLKNDGVLTVHLANLSVTTGKLANLSVTEDKIVAGSVTTLKISAGGVTTDRIANLAVTTDKLGDLSVTSGKLASNAVTTAKITNLNVTTDKIADGAITNIKIGAGVVTDDKIADGNITASKIANLAVTNEKLAEEAITASKIGGSLIPKQMVSNGYTSSTSVTGSWSDIFSDTIVVARNGSWVRCTAVVYGSTSDDVTPMGLRIACNGIVIGTGNVGSSSRTAAGAIIPPTAFMHCATIDFMHTRDAGEYTYSLQARVADSKTGYFNRNRSDADNSDTYRTRSTITLTECS